MSDLTVQAAVPADREAWDTLVSALPDSEAAHLWGYPELLVQRFGVGLYRLFALRDGRPVGLLPLVFQKSLVGRFLTSVPYLNYAGILSQDQEARSALARAAGDLADRLQAQRLELRGRNGGDLPLPAWEGKSGYTLDLSTGRDVLWKRLKSKVRAQIRRPLKDGYASRVATAEASFEFYPLFSRRWHELGSPALPRRFFEDLADLFGDRLDFVFVEKEGHIAAAGLLLEWNGRVEIPWAASELEHNRFGVNMLLYWAAIERAVDRGARGFDFGRSTPGTGNAKFKLQWGATEQPLVWNLRVSGSYGQAAERGDSRRELVARAWRRLPRFAADMLGPRLAARIPL